MLRDGLSQQVGAEYMAPTAVCGQPRRVARRREARGLGPTGDHTSGEK